MQEKSNYCTQRREEKLQYRTVVVWDNAVLRCSDVKCDVLKSAL